MTETEQLEALIRLGHRLNDWVSPGDENDWFDAPERRLLIGTAAKLSPPIRLIDALLARWIYIKDFQKQKPVKFLLSPSQHDLSRNLASRNIILKAGKVFFTTYFSMRGLIRTATKQGHLAVQIAHEQKPAEDYFGQVHFAWRCLPEQLRKGALKPGKGNVRELYFPALNSRYYVETAGDKMAAIGQSIQYALATEVARWAKGDPKAVMANILSHTVGEDTEVNLESRPWGDQGYFHDEYWAARRDENGFKPHFYPWWWNPLHAVDAADLSALTPEESALCERYERWRVNDAPQDSGLPQRMDARAIQWRRERQRELRDLFPQEFAEDEVACFLGSGDCPFSATAIKAILDADAQPYQVYAASGETDNGLWKWGRPESGHRYVISIDPAGGLHLSRTAMQVIDADTAEQVAEYQGRIDGFASGAIARELGNEYNTAQIACESNLGAISGTILNTLAGYPNLFRYTDRGKNELGWPTNSVTRPAMYDLLGQMVAEAPHLFHSRRLAQDLKSHGREGDSIRPKKGFTGDLTSAMAIAHSVRQRMTMRREPWVDVISVGRGGEEERGWTRIS